MPYNPKSRFPKSKNEKLNKPVNLDLGRLQSAEAVPIRQRVFIIREFLDDPIQIAFGIGPKTSEKLQKQGIYTVGQLLNKLKHYKNPQRSKIYQELPPQAKSDVQNLLKSSLVKAALRNYKGPQKNPLSPKKTTKTKEKPRKSKRTSEEVEKRYKLTMKVIF